MTQTLSNTAIPQLTPQELQQARALAPAAVEFAVASGVVRYRKEGGIGHLPLTLFPWKTRREFWETGRLATLVYNRMYHQVARDVAFLESSLAELRAADSFVAGLFDSVSPDTLTKPSLYLSRSDYMPMLIQDRWVPKQIEMNLMAASLGCASEKVYEIQRELYGPHHEAIRKMPPNPAGTGLAASLAEVFHLIAAPESQILFIVPPGEVNAFDQRILQGYLMARHGIHVRRTTLEEVADVLENRSGKAFFEGREVAIAYFRAGYSPDHYQDARAWRARKALEASSAICVPNALTQLANTKKMQQVLRDRSVLLNYVSPVEADLLLHTQVAMAPLNQEIEWEGKRGQARDFAIAHPDRWVLKPSREGGGNNFFGDEMVSKLKTMDRVESEAYILMEAIIQPPRIGIRLIQEEVVESDCVTELGHFTGCFYQGGEAEPLFNRTFGYLQRTKDVSNKEGLVLGGYSYLDSVTLVD